jgi:hypothetical protein
MDIREEGNQHFRVKNKIRDDQFILACARHLYDDGHNAKEENSF